jgi:putative ABC transport system permease protein
MNKTNEKRPQPPWWAQRLLSFWGDPDTLEEVQGDLLEFYAHWAQTTGEQKARWRYFFTVLTLLRPFTKPKTTKAYNQPFLILLCCTTT